MMKIAYDPRAVDHDIAHELRVAGEADRPRVVRLALHLTTQLLSFRNRFLRIPRILVSGSAKVRVGRRVYWVSDPAPKQRRSQRPPEPRAQPSCGTAGVLSARADDIGESKQRGMGGIGRFGFEDNQHTTAGCAATGAADQAEAAGSPER